VGLALIRRCGRLSPLVEGHGQGRVGLHTHHGVALAVPVAAHRQHHGRQLQHGGGVEVVGRRGGGGRREVGRVIRRQVDDLLRAAGLQESRMFAGLGFGLLPLRQPVLARLQLLQAVRMPALLSGQALATLPEATETSLVVVVSASQLVPPVGIVAQSSLCAGALAPQLAQFRFGQVLGRPQLLWRVRVSAVEALQARALARVPGAQFGLEELIHGARSQLPATLQSAQWDVCSRVGDPS